MNIQEMMKQAQKLQATLKKKLAEFDATEFEHNYKDLIKVKMMGTLEIKSLEFIDKEIIDPEDSEMLSDLIIAALNETTQEILNKKEQLKSSIAPGMGNLL